MRLARGHRARSIHNSRVVTSNRIPFLHEPHATRMNVDLAWIASVRFAQIQNSQVCNPLAREIKEANHDSKNVYVGNSSRNRRSNESKFEPMPEVESIRKMSFMSETNHQRLRG